MNIKALVTKLNSIPHLPLQYSYDAKKIEDEIRTMPLELHDYEATMQANHEHVVTKWKNLSLYSNDGDYKCNKLEGAGEGEIERIWGHFTKTKLGEYLPYTYQVIDDLGAGKALARIEEIRPKATMGWHNHVFELSHPETMMIIQVPIKIPALFKYSVISNKDYRMTDFGTSKVKIHESTYTPGTPVVFNAYHYHNVFNYDHEQERLTIRFFADIRDPKVYQIMERAVDEYKGEYIED